MRESEYFLWLTRIKGMDRKTKRLLLKKYKSAERIWNASEDELNEFLATKKHTHSIISSKKEDDIKKWIDELTEKRIRFVPITSKRYPKLLREIPDAPLAIYVIGELPAEDDVCVSVVGTRRCSEYGRIVTKKICKQLALRGVTIISGMARGIDCAAHEGAIEAKGKTVAVLGCGADICYPPEHIDIKEQVNCIISEYPPGTTPKPYMFPERNRIISGLTMLTLVTEAPQKSGALITCNQALEQGREVCAVPGNITSPLSEGPNEIIKQGAIMVTSADDILMNLGLYEAENDQEEKAPIGLTKEEQDIYSKMSFEPLHADYFMQMGYTASEVLGNLTMLELKGLIQQVSAQRYIKKI